MTKSETIRSVYFGGSFDPPHLGHYEMLLSLARDSWTQKLFVVPTSTNPLKENDDRNSIWANLENRKLWTTLIIEEAKETLNKEDAEKIILCEDEISNPNNMAYTVDTLASLRQKNPEVNTWSLAIGSDLLESLPKWKELNRLLSLIESVWIFPRGKSSEIIIPSEFQNLCAFRIMAQSIPIVSSTEIRDNIHNSGTASCKNLIPESVLRSIQQLL